MFIYFFYFFYFFRYQAVRCLSQKIVEDATKVSSKCKTQIRTELAIQVIAYFLLPISYCIIINSFYMGDWIKINAALVNLNSLMLRV